MVVCCFVGVPTHLPYLLPLRLPSFLVHSPGQGIPKDRPAEFNVASILIKHWFLKDFLNDLLDVKAMLSCESEERNILVVEPGPMGCEED